MVEVVPVLIATYNVLANAYLRPALYRGVPERFLDPRRRRAAMLSRVSGLGADVVCLQEVEEDCAQDLERHLAGMGYSGVWRKKLNKLDGAATFVRGAALRSSEAHYYEDGSGHLALLTDLRFGSRDLLIANTHLKWDDPATPPESRWCVEQAESLARVVASRSGDAVVCGDMNVTADDVTLARLLAVGLRDVFVGADEPHTCLSNGRTQKIDHILTRGDLQATPRRDPTARGAVFLPSETEPSDHIPLVAELAWR